MERTRSSLCRTLHSYPAEPMRRSTHQSCVPSPRRIDAKREDDAPADRGRVTLQISFSYQMLRVPVIFRAEKLHNFRVGRNHLVDCIGPGLGIGLGIVDRDFNLKVA